MSVKEELKAIIREMSYEEREVTPGPPGVKAIFISTANRRPSTVAVGCWSARLSGTR